MNGEAFFAARDPVRRFIAPFFGVARFASVRLRVVCHGLGPFPFVWLTFARSIDGLVRLFVYYIVRSFIHSFLSF